MKSRIAFRMTAERLVETSERTYFWTATFYSVHADWECLKLWRRFLDHLRKVLGGGWGGVRVAELHKDRGVHFHFLINLRVAIDLVRRVGQCYGIGRIDVRRVRRSGYMKEGSVAVNVAKYMAKYLSKQKDVPLTESGRRARRWAAFGEVVATRASDIVNESPMWVYRREKGLPFLGYAEEAVLQRCWLFSEDTCKAAWFSMARAGGVTGDAAAMAQGCLEVRGVNDWVWREKLCIAAF